MGDLKATASSANIEKALREKFKRGEDALAALGLDPELLKAGLAQDSTEELTKMKNGRTKRVAQAAATLSKLAMDQATPDDVILKLVGMIAPGGGGEEAPPPVEGEESKDASVSEAQHGAMGAAAGGNSTLGIPKKVGEEFMEKDKGKGFDEDNACGQVCQLLESSGVDPAVVAKVKSMLGGDMATDSEENPNEPKQKQIGGIVGHHDVANDEPPDFPGKPQVGGGMAGDEEKDLNMGKDQAEGENVVSKPAMDAAIKDAVASERKLQRDIYEARAQVRPYVGELGLALDSVEEVYRAALTGMGKTAADLEGINTPGLKALLKAHPVPGSKTLTQRETRVAMDAAASKNFHERNPDLKRIRVL